MLSESFIASTLSKGGVSSLITSSLKDVSICQHEVQPQVALRNGYKKSSTDRNCLAISENHIFAAQADKAVINVYNVEKGNQEATVAFPERIHSLAYAHGTGVLVLGAKGGRLLLWEISSGRLTTSSAAHLQPVTSLYITVDNFILSASEDSSIHVWSLPHLVSFSQRSDAYSSEPSLDPVTTFSAHRKAITGLACGKSKLRTNFAISASEDNTCYMWSIESCQILQTYLLPSTPLCFSIDIADRAAFAGYRDGSLQRIDFYEAQNNNYTRIQNHSTDHPIQLDSKNAWPAATIDSGSVNCLTISFDGTTIYSGTESGKVQAWDVAKGRFQKTIIEFFNPVTNIHMLRPDGLPPSPNEPRFEIKTVVKPRLELNTKSTGSCDIPSNYSLNIQITKSAPKDNDDFHNALTAPYFSQSLLDEALAELQSHPIRNPTEPPSDAHLLKIDRLESQVATLSNKLEYLQDLSEQSRARRLARAKRREEFGLKKRTTYFEAKKKGEDGDVAMAEWAEKETNVDVESDEEELGKEVYADLD